MFELMTGWHWLGLAVIFFVIEFLTLKSVATALALAALCVAITSAFTVLPVGFQCLLFAVAATVSLAFVWWRWHRNLPKTQLQRWKKQANSLIGVKASVLDMSGASADKARVQIQNAIWTVRAEQPLKAGVLVEVIGYGEFELHVKIL